MALPRFAAHPAWAPALIALAALALALAGTASAQTTCQTTLTYLTLSEFETAMQPVIDAFEQRNPGICVHLEGQSFDDLFQTTQVRMRAKDSGIDILLVDQPVVAAYTALGFLAPLDGTFSQQQLDGAWVDAALQAGMVNGRLMAAPQDSSIQLLYFNRALFDAAGVTPPAGLVPGKTVSYADMQALADGQRWTWEQVVAAAKKLTTRSGGSTSVWGFIFGQPTELYQLQPLGASLGASILSPDGKTADGYLNGPAWVKAAGWYGDLSNGSNVSPKGVPYPQTADLFAEGKVALFAGGAWQLPKFEKSGVDFGVAPYPAFAGGKAVTPTGGWYLGVAAYSQHEQAARAFIRFLTAEQGATLWFRSYGHFPTQQAVLDQIESDPRYTTFPDDAYLLGVYQSRHTALLRPLTPAYLQLHDIFDSAFSDIRNGADPKQALDAAVQQVDPYLKRFQ
ncbi:MAG TPA: sugar ABC transporter substrate-binding protein [Trueperaceae bacterium]|nr:sugar ABC transporter substrate-binding protein [Trueperaceae bacterium]